VFDPLIHRKDGHIARSGESAVVEQIVQTVQHRSGSVAADKDPVDEVWAGQMKHFLTYRLARVTEQIFSILPE
jgi:hypothetical protein